VRLSTNSRLDARYRVRAELPARLLYNFIACCLGTGATLHYPCVGIHDLTEGFAEILETVHRRVVMLRI
jgi:hypothetical protein